MTHTFPRFRITIFQLVSHALPLAHRSVDCDVLSPLFLLSSSFSFSPSPLLARYSTGLTKIARLRLDIAKKANNARNERETKKDRRYEEKIQRSNRKRRRKTICSIERRARYVEILRIDYSAWNVGSQPSGLRVYVSKYFHARGKQWCGDTFLDRKFDKCVAPRNWLLSYPLVRGGY